MKKADKIKINIFHGGACVNTTPFATKAQAKQYYEQQSAVRSQYTQLVVGELVCTTAQAARYFGAKAPCVRQW